MIDDAMLAEGKDSLAPFGSRAKVVVADATDLDYPDGSFDFVFSFLMLHHVIAWEKALEESVRVLRPGGQLVGYDLLDSRAFRLFHRIAGADVHLMRLDELFEVADSLPLDRLQSIVGLGRSVVRFKMRKTSSPFG